MKNLARGQGQGNREHSKAPREKRKMKLPASEASRKFSGSRNQQRSKNCPYKVKKEREKGKSIK